MKIITGEFDKPWNHHKGWFRVFRFGSSIVEVWFGRHWLMIERNKT